MQLNGLVLISSVLDLGSQDFRVLRHDEACLSFLPTYAAIAHYHGKHPGRSLQEVLAEAEEFAAGRYRWALGRGNRLTDAERREVVGELARLSGLSEEYVDRCDLRPEHWRFCTELLRERGETVGASRRAGARCAAVPQVGPVACTAVLHQPVDHPELGVRGLDHHLPLSRLVLAVRSLAAMVEAAGELSPERPLVDQVTMAQALVDPDAARETLEAFGPRTSTRGRPGPI